MTLRLALALLLLAALGLSGCAQSDASSAGSAALPGTAWRLDYFSCPPWSLPVLPFSRITLAFGSSQAMARGQSGVNLYGSEYRVEGDRLTFPLVQYTQVSSLWAPLMAQEQAYLTLFSRVGRFELSGRRLILACAGGQRLVFRAEAGAAQPS